MPTIKEKVVLTKEERRAKKAERRAKQRAENAGRAAKMHAARLLAEPKVQKTKFQFPKKRKDLPGKKSSTKSGNRNLKPRPYGAQLHVGCSGWFYWDWKGKFYPADLPTSKWFPHYTKTFKTVELNAPFYSWPTVGTVKSWVRQAGKKNFVYTVKASELITHTKQFLGTKTLVRDFGYIADLLGERMGCFLFQLPPSFHYSKAKLNRIVSQLDPARRNVVEFRHKSWWNKTVYEAFRKAGIIFCSCSGPKMPDELITTSDDIYLRFHGVEKWYRHDYSDAELKVWSDRIKASGAKRVWVYFNNDFNGFAIKNAKTLERMLRVRAKGQVPISK